MRHWLCDITSIFMDTMYMLITICLQFLLPNQLISSNLQTSKFKLAVVHWIGTATFVANYFLTFTMGLVVWLATSVPVDPLLIGVF